MACLAGPGRSPEHPARQEGGAKETAELQANPAPPQGATRCPPSLARWTPPPGTLPSAQGRGTGRCPQGGSLEEAQPPVTEQAQRPELIPCPHRSHWKHQGQEAGGWGPLAPSSPRGSPAGPAQQPWTQSRPSLEHHPPPVKPGKHSWPLQLLQRRGGLAASNFFQAFSKSASLNRHWLARNHSRNKFRVL